MGFISKIKTYLREMMDLLYDTRREVVRSKAELQVMNTRIQAMDTTIRAMNTKIQGLDYEMLWARTWDDTKKGMEWIQDLPGISPGRWAVGYNYLYVMTRLLNEMNPKNVLDFGLGISSTLISQYFKGNQIADGHHDVVEQDEDWIRFYHQKNRVSDATTIHTVPCVEKEVDGCKYNAYVDIAPVVRGKKYDIISIDGPKGSKEHSRRDILPFLPDILNDRFVIIMDDAQRKGEAATLEEIRNILREHNIAFCEGRYPGSTDCVVITSEDCRFFCSM